MICRPLPFFFFLRNISGARATAVAHWCCRLGEGKIMNIPKSYARVARSQELRQSGVKRMLTTKESTEAEIWLDTWDRRTSDNSRGGLDGTYLGNDLRQLVLSCLESGLFLS